MGRTSIPLRDTQRSLVTAKDVCDPKQPDYIGDCTNLTDEQRACVTDAYELIDAKYPVRLEHPMMTTGMDDFDYQLQAVQWTFGICTPETAGDRWQHGSLAVRLMRENGGRPNGITCIDGGCHAILADEFVVRGHAPTPTDKTLLDLPLWIYYPLPRQETLTGEVVAPLCNSCHPVHAISGRALASNAFGVNLVFDATSTNSSPVALPPMVSDKACDSCHVSETRPPAESAEDISGSQAKRNLVERSQTQPCQACHPAKKPEQTGERK